MTPGPTGPTRSASPEARPSLGWKYYVSRSAITAATIGIYYAVREPFRETACRWYENAAGSPLDVTAPRIVGVMILMAALVYLWRQVVIQDKRFHAPLLATTVLLVGDAAFNILENLPAPAWLASLSHGAILEYSPGAFAVLTTILAEMLLGRFFWRKWPHMASAYITGISVAILIKSSLLWPYVLCGLISITSKYVLRVHNRHIWNPSNFGVTMMLLLAPQYVASLSVQAGNNGWAIVTIWVIGSLIMHRLGRFHIPFAFVLTFVPLAFFRSWFTHQPWQTEIAPITSPMFQLYIFFMITDPPTTTRKRWSQVLVAVLVAMMETFWRLAYKDVHSLYHALFTIGPITNLIEIYYLRWRDACKKKAAASQTAPAVAAANGTAVPAEALARQ